LGDDVAVFAKENRTRAGGSLVEREDIGHQAFLLRGLPEPENLVRRAG
jgi:hypothetical protein